MDPRIRRRRVEVRRQEGRRRLRLLIALTAVVAVALGGWAAIGSPLLDVDAIVVAGASHTAPGDVVFASSLHPGQAMVHVDLGTAARRIDALPWVLHATVRRQWPGRIRITVSERAPVAVAPAAAGGSALLDATGRVLDVVGQAPPGLAVLAGLPPAGPPGSTLPTDDVAALSVAVALPAELRARTAGVGPVGGTTGEVELRLVPEGTVRLGPPDDLGRKFDAVRAVLAQVDLHNLAVLDVRRPENPVLTRRDAPTKVSTPRAG